MKKTLSICLVMICMSFCLNAKSSERKVQINEDWQFALNDSTFSNSRIVDLPHDWSIEGDFDKDAPAGNDGGYLPTGKGYYKKTLILSNSDLDKKIQLYFEGVYMNSKVYVNGREAGGHPYGYTSFFVDATPFIKEGANEVVVNVDNSQQKNCRWYSGSGIYRNVWLITTKKLFVDNWGIQITTPDEHTVQINAEVKNETSSAADITVVIAIEGLDGTKEVKVNVPANGSQKVTQSFQVANPKLWSPETPVLYSSTVTLKEGDKVLDEVSQSFGIRTLEYSAQKGLLLNGKSIELNGACVHHDNGILGAAAYDRAEYRKAELLKEAGFNAVRTSHNASSEAFLDACDRVGLLVIDEAFDGWRESKNKYDYSTLIDKWWQADMGALVLRDRNHPSVFCWSIGNEIIERKKIECVKTAHKLATLCRTLDGTRPVTSALAAWDNDWDIYDPLAAEHDIVGYNYMIHKAESDHARVPERVMMQTESYPRDAAANWKRVMKYPYLIGDFVWTGIDYIGESGIGRWYYEGDVVGEHYSRPLYPWHAAYCGDIDLTGWRKPISHYRSLLYNDTEKLYMAVREPNGYYGRIKETHWSVWPTWESWNWEGHEGKDITIDVYSKYPFVSLYLNDKLIEKKEVKDGIAVFTLPYQPGTLKAEGGNGETVAETCILSTAGDAKTIKLTADRKVINADGNDLVFVTVEVLDGKGLPQPNADNELTFTVKGAGTLIAAGSADIKDEDSYVNSTHKLWKGRALAVVRSNGKKGNITLTVTSPNLKKSSVKVSAK